VDTLAYPRSILKSSSKGNPPRTIPHRSENSTYPESILKSSSRGNANRLEAQSVRSDPTYRNAEYSKPFSTDDKSEAEHQRTKICFDPSNTNITIELANYDTRVNVRSLQPSNSARMGEIEIPQLDIPGIKR
jgi:hypothetical protein